MSLSNHVQLLGNLGQKPELTTLPSGKKVLNLSLATNSYYKNDKGEFETSTQWHPLKAWGKTAERMASNLDKGSKLMVTGVLEQRSWVNAEGQRRKNTEVIVNEFMSFEGKKADEKELAVEF